MSFQLIKVAANALLTLDPEGRGAGAVAVVVDRAGEEIAPCDATAKDSTMFGRITSMKGGGIENATWKSQPIMPLSLWRRTW